MAGLFDDIPMAEAEGAAPAEAPKAQAGLFDDIPMAPKAQESRGLFDDIEVTNKPQYSTPETPEQDSYLDIAGKLGGRFVEGMKEAGGGIAQAVGEALDIARAPTAMAFPGLYEATGGKELYKPLTEGGAAYAAEAREKRQTGDLALNLDREKDYVKYAVGNIADATVSQLLPTIATGLVTGPAGALTFLGSQIGGQKYSQSRSEGRRPDQALMDSAFTVGSEVITERIPLKIFLETGGPLLTRVLKGTAAEGTQETITEVLQKAYDAGVVAPDASVKDVLAEMGSPGALRDYVDAFVIGAGAGAVGATVTQPFVGGKEVTPTPSVAEDIAKEIETIQAEEALPEEATKQELAPVEPLPPIEPAPEQEFDEVRFLQGLDKQATENILRLSNPEIADETPAIPISPKRRDLDAPSGGHWDAWDVIQRVPSGESLRAAETDPGVRDELILMMSNLDTAVTSSDVKDMIVRKIIPELGKNNIGQAFTSINRLSEQTMSRDDRAVLRYWHRAAAQRVGGTIESDLTQVKPGKPIVRGLGGYVDRDLRLPKGKVTEPKLRAELEKRRGKSIDFTRRVQQMAEGFLQEYAPGVRLVIALAENAPATYDPKDYGSMAYVPTKNPDGSADKIFTLQLNQKAIAGLAKGTGVSENAAMAEILHHELGHVLSFSEFVRAPKVVKIAILNDYRKWLRERRLDESMESFGASWRAPLHYKENFWGATQTAGDANLTPDYWYSFNEFIAEGVARIMYKQGPPMNPVAKPFYRKVFEELQDIWKKLTKGNPELQKVYPSIEAWLNSLRYRNALERLGAGPTVPSAKYAKAMGSATMATGSENDLQALADKVSSQVPNLPKNTKKQLSNSLKGTAKFRWWMQQILTIPQLEREFGNIPGMRRTVGGIRQWWATKGYWTNKAMETLAFAREIGLEQDKQKLKAYEKFAIKASLRSDKLQRGLTDEELQDLAREVNLSKEGFDFWERTQKDYNDSVNKAFDLFERDVRMELGQKDPIAMQKKINELQKRRAELLQKNYHPLMRYGKYGVNVKALEDVVVDGQEFKKGETVYFELAESSNERLKIYAWASGKFSGDKFQVEPRDIKENENLLIGMPDFIIDKMVDLVIKEANGLNLSAEELSELRAKISSDFSQLKVEYSPGSGWTKRLMNRKGTPGFSTDALRSYASYMQNFANFISRVEHSQEIISGIEQIEASTNQLRAGISDPKVTERLSKLSEYLREHYKYLMNPGNELANVRSFFTVWYLGFSPRAALVNLTQVPLATEAYLEKRYGLAGTVKELTRSWTALKAGWTGGAKGKVEPELAEAYQRGYDEMFLNESLASELGAYSEGSNLQRLLPGWVPGGKSRAVNYGIRQVTNLSMAPFQFAERLNRLFTFTATFRLERDKLLDGRKFDSLDVAEQQSIKEQAFVTAREAVEVTQGEYARWARPDLMKGQKSVFLMFKLYLQHMAYFLAKDPARWRFLRNSLLLGGIMGAPFAQNFADILQSVLQSISDDDEKVDVKKDLKEWLQENMNAFEGAPDILMHGVGRGYGSVFPFDLSASLSLGTMIPMTGEIAPTGVYTDPHAVVGKTLEEVGGPVVAAAMNAIRAVGASDAPDEWKRWERAMPTFVKSISRAARVAARGEETNYKGYQVQEFDIHNMEDLIQVAGMALGFTPRSITSKQALSWDIKQAEKFYQARRSTIMRQYYQAVVADDREAISDVWKALENYNQTAPDYVPGIAMKDLRRSLEDRLKGKFMYERGLPSSKRGYGLYQEYQKAYPEVEWEEPSR